MDATKPAWIALGGNIGDVAESFRQTRQTLDKHPQCSVQKQSLLYQTPPMGPEGQDDYLNAMLLLDTSLPPLDVLDLLQSIEQQHGRVRHIHWGARTLDLDIIAYDDVIMQQTRLTIPHPYMHQRQFVLRPMCDISPTWMHPKLHQTAEQLQAKQIQQGEAVLPQGQSW